MRRPAHHRRRPPRRGRQRLAFALATTALATTALACSGQEPAPTSSSPVSAPSPTDPHGGGADVTTNPAAAAAGPGIERFAVPASVTCSTGGDAVVAATWAVPEATLVRFVVDGTGRVGDHPGTGSTDLSIPCDGAVHVVVLAALGSDGATAVSSRAVLTEPTG